MHQNTGWLFPGTTLETILKTRPLAVALFERHGLDPWKAPHESLAALCAGRGVACPAICQEILRLPIPRPDSDWTALPASHLLDFLTAQHREFTRIFVPAIGHILSNIPDADAESLFHMRGFAQEWPAFTSALHSHISEEENELFHRILRYDASLRLGAPDPEFAGGSVQVFTVVRMHEHDHRDMALLNRFLAKALPAAPATEGRMLEAQLRPMLREFQDVLGRHARLETDVLFPWGRSLEKSLYDLRIQGRVKSAVADSGRMVLG